VTRRIRDRWRDERGMATAELVLLTPLAFVVLAGERSGAPRPR
jgi:hypothetical protein